MYILLVASWSRRTRREDQTGGPDGRTRREDPTGGSDGRTRQEDQTGGPDGRTRLEDQTGGPDGRTAIWSYLVPSGGIDCLNSCSIILHFIS